MTNPTTPQPTDGAIALKFRKRPVVIEAMRFDGTVATANKIRFWATQSDGMSAECGMSTKGEVCYGISIRTLEGTMRADSGDWIIRGVKGEFYPCKPEIFVATYEPADATRPAQLGGGVVSDEDVERALDAFDEACKNDKSRIVSWFGHTRDDRLAIMRAALEAALGKGGA